MNEVEEMPLLPIGSVVELKDEIKKPVMIYGRKLEATNGKEYDYLVCAYPEGLIPGHLDLGEEWLITKEQIAKLLFIGYQTPREAQMREMLENPQTSTEWDWTEL